MCEGPGRISQIAIVHLIRGPRKSIIALWKTLELWPVVYWLRGLGQLFNLSGPLVPT